MNTSRATLSATLKSARLALAPLVLLILGTVSTAAFSQQSTQQPARPPAGVGTVTHLSGTLAARGGTGATRFLSVNSAVSEGDLLSTQQDTYARVKFADGSEMVLRPQSQLKVENFRFEDARPQNDNILLSLFKGGLRSVSGIIGKRNRDRVSYATPTATVGIRGTHFGALFCSNDCGGIPAAGGRPPPNGLHLDVAQGAIVVKNTAGEVVLNAGQFGYVQNQGSLPVIVPPSQGIQVTMPVSISRNGGGGSTLGSNRQDNECVL